MTFVLFIILALQTSTAKDAVENDIWNPTPLNNVSEIELPADVLKGNWTTSSGIKLDDLTDLSNVPAPSRQDAQAIAKQMKPIGVCSVADYSLVSTDFPLNTVIVRVFVFEDAAKCRTWWTKKYEYVGCEKHYIKVDSDIARIVHSSQTNKTAMAFGNVWLTTHQLGKGKDHITAANHVLKMLTNGKRLLPVEPKPAFTNKTVGATLTAESSWATIPDASLDRINTAAVQPVILHAKKLGVTINPEDVFSKILLFQSRLPLGSDSDNPNFLFAAEKVWTDEFQRNGSGYLELMADRVEKLNAPTSFSLPPKKMEIGGHSFYYADAENTRVKNAITKQRYICGFNRDHYIYFVVSYNDENDEDFKKMMSCIESLKLTK